jgi:serine/threonine-protein kinase
VLSDRYRLDERLATGGMGEVWRATDQTLGRTVAVKVLLPALLAQPGFAARFQAEARMMSAVPHPGVVRVYDYGETTVDTGNVVYLVMAYVEGEPLSHRIAAAGRLGAAETMSLVAQAADALEPVHAAGIVHRDVKPANLLVQPDGTVTLVDFGVAHDTASTRLTGTNMVLGTALYMAPEQVSGQPVSAATDIYALGAVAYHCLAGEPPFGGGTALEIAAHHLHEEPPPLPDDVPAAVRAVVERALAKDPAARYASAAAFAAAARAAAAGTGAGAATVPLSTVAVATVPVPPVRGAEPTTLSDMDAVPAGDTGPGWSRRRMAVVAGSVAAVLLTVVAVIAVLAMMRAGNNVRAPSPSASSPSATPAATTPSRPVSTRTTPPRQTTAPTQTTPATPLPTGGQSGPGNTQPPPPPTTQPPASAPG